MKAEGPPAAPHGPRAMMKSYNDLRDFIMRRQVKDVVAKFITSKSITTTPQGRFVQWGMPSGDNLNSGGTGGPGACCHGGVCSIADEATCGAIGGVYFGPGTVCTPTICSGIGTIGACCHGTACSTTTDFACIASGGIFLGGACTPELCLGCPAGTGACCDTIGGCTNSPPGTCGGVFTCGAACSEVVCVPTEPDGACCQTPTSPCVVTPESGCSGLFHEFIDCSYIGSCEHDFCGPISYWCACEDRTHGYIPTPCCCPNELPTCATCWDSAGQLQYCCCCVYRPPYGWLCQ